MTPRELLLNGLEMVKSTIIGSLQKVEDGLEKYLIDDQLPTEAESPRPALNFDQDSEDDVEDALTMAFEKQPSGGKQGNSSSDDSVPQSPPS